ncbi:protoporphyrinogen/coproporphyrinogen oxidase [Streptomonospora wellingtoniae]|uniref:FAD-dependent oxidoreductase n=1 Tax=Streptomonospora wellingtoniae TaxID=3075544 RepID=A0ABU2KQ76_9ACTN|nr:FAD-dependent oxidoreductase [Streptomonospora sp. DSM 45055]MDT0301413.1 FAD-dependent oxidoreductase [Streptomonospora sp. DSM 45055]
MTAAAPPDIDAAVVGAGIGGLATAHALRRAGREVQVFEAADSVGGRMRTLRRGGWTVDTGAEMIPSAGYPATWALIRELGFGAADVPRVSRALSVWRDGRARPNAGRPLGLLTGAGLSARARLELLRLLSGGGDEATGTLEEFAERLGPELRDGFLFPLAAGFFGWRPERSAAAPLLAHLRSTGSAAHWRTYRDGMDTLARRLAAGLDVATGRVVHEVAAVPGGARLTLDGTAVTARSAVLAVPAPLAGGLHPGAPQEERDFLAACSFAPMLRVSLELARRPAGAAGMRGFAVLIPAAEDDLVNVVTLDHNKHPDRAPAGRGLVSLVSTPRATASLIGAGDAEIAAALAERAERYLPGLRGLLGRVHVHRFPHGLPEAAPAALRARAAFRGRPARAIDYAGDWVELRPCSEGAVASAHVAASRVLADAAERCPAHGARPVPGKDNR